MDAPPPGGLRLGITMIGKQASRILASAGGFLETVEPKWRGVVAIVAAVSVGFTSGVGFLAFAGNYATHETRLVTLEDWRVAHEDTVSIPGITMAENNRDAVNELRDDLTRIRDMVFQMYCSDFPDRCEGVPR